jgi:hypothetical protein
MNTKWPPDFSKQPFYYLDQPFALLELAELFDGKLVREKYVHVAKCVLRENDDSPRQIERPEIHEKARGYRYCLEAGCADYILPYYAYNLPPMVIVESGQMRFCLLELVREFAIFV